MKVGSSKAWVQISDRQNIVKSPGYQPTLCSGITAFSAFQPAKDSKRSPFHSLYCASWGKGSYHNGGLGRKINLDSAN